MKVLTFNMAMGEISSAAENWSMGQNMEAMVQLMATVAPDIITLQEMPSPNTFNFRDLKPTSFASSHCGHVGVYVRKEMDVVDTFHHGPAVITEIEYNSSSFHFVGLHLLPFKQNEENRLLQLSSIMKLLDLDLPVILAGDFNVRESETSKIVKAHPIHDAFYLAGGPKDKKYTWDSRINLFTPDGYPFICRFDRIFVRGFEVKQFDLFANQPLTNKNHFISDHFGIITELASS